MLSTWLAVIYEKPDSRPELKDMKLEKTVMMMILFPACSFVSLLLPRLLVSSEGLR